MAWLVVEEADPENALFEEMSPDSDSDSSVDESFLTKTMNLR